jgi:hypothetical protein
MTRVGDYLHKILSSPAYIARLNPTYPLVIKPLASVHEQSTTVHLSFSQLIQFADPLHIHTSHLPIMAPYTYSHSASNISSLIASISKANISYSTDPSIRNLKSNTPHSPALSHETPLAVFFPKSTEETSIILKACNDRRIAVTSFSGGTSLGGALTALRGGVCVSFEKMDRVVRLNEDDMDVVVQPGLGWVELNEQVKEKGVFFPVDPAPGARIGGMVRFSSLPISWYFTY